MAYIYYNVNVEAVIRASHEVLEAIEKADKEHGCGDRMQEEDDALEVLRETIKGYTGASWT
jgi:hypothetical protein